MPAMALHWWCRAEDAEQFESKRRGRGGGGEGPAWASGRVSAKKQAEMDEDDAFAVREGWARQVRQAAWWPG